MTPCYTLDETQILEAARGSAVPTSAASPLWAPTALASL